MTETKPMYGKKNKEKEGLAVSPRQVRGLIGAFAKIRNSNPTLKGKADYWLMKNEHPLRETWEQVCQDRNAIYEANVVMKEVNGTKYFTNIGKDETDILLSDVYGYYKEFEKDGKTELEYLNPSNYKETGGAPTWEKLVPEEKEGDVVLQEEMIVKTPYKLNYKSEADKEACIAAVNEFENAENYNISLWKLSFEDFDGVMVAWPDPNNARESMEEFRKLIYEHALKP